MRGNSSMNCRAGTGPAFATAAKSANIRHNAVKHTGRYLRWRKPLSAQDCMLDLLSEHVAVERTERRRSLVKAVSQRADSVKSALLCCFTNKVEQWPAVSVERGI